MHQWVKERERKAELVCVIEGSLNEKAEMDATKAMV